MKKLGEINDIKIIIESYQAELDETKAQTSRPGEYKQNMIF